MPRIYLKTDTKLLGDEAEDLLSYFGVEDALFDFHMRKALGAERDDQFFRSPAPLKPYFPELQANTGTLYGILRSAESATEIACIHRVDHREDGTLELVIVETYEPDTVPGAFEALCEALGGELR